MEDQLKEQAEKDKRTLNAEWEQKLRRAIEETQKNEQEKARVEIHKVRQEYDH